MSTSTAKTTHSVPYKVSPLRGGTTNGAAPQRRTRRSDPPGPEPLGGTSDPRAARARELHRKAAEADELAARYRLERDQLIHRLRPEDSEPGKTGA